MIRVERLTKSYGPKTVVSDLNFEVSPGVVTGFLGPNGSGKSTTMRLILGLDLPDSGAATVMGKALSSFTHPLRQVGALLDPGYLHPTRSAMNHLWAQAASNGIGRRRVEETLAMVGLADVSHRRIGEFSLGMKQRLGIAGALLGDPAVVILDEPANGLDPEGVHWIRTFLSTLAAEGRTVLVSSHQLSEMALMAEDLVIIGAGQLLAQTTVAEFTSTANASVLVRTPDRKALHDVLVQAGVSVRFAGETLEVTGWAPAEIGRLAFTSGIEIHELTPRNSSLESAFLALTAETQEYRTSTIEGTHLA